VSARHGGGAPNRARPGEVEAGARPEVRSPIRRVLDVWGFVPPLSVPHTTVGFRTRDDVELVGDLLRGPAPEGGPAILLLHGFAGHRRKPAYARMAERLARDVTVLALDLRGHGASAGTSSLGATEVHDVRAAAAWLRRAGHDWVAAVGASMGATAALRASGQTPGIVDAVAAISAPAAFVDDAGAPVIAALGRLTRSPALRVAARLALRVRVAPAWRDPTPSVELVGAIAPTPLLLVHGVDDGWFAIDHLDRLEEAAREPVTVWREPAGFGHAEDGFSEEFLDRLAAAAALVRRHGRWPGGSAAPPAHGGATGATGAAGVCEDARHERAEDMAMTVRVRLFAAVREAAGVDEVAVAPAPLPELLDGLRQRFGEPFASRLAVCTVLVDGDATAHDDPADVADGGEVVLLPPVSGGARTAPAPAPTLRRP
jgi:uncharacterized protein